MTIINHLPLSSRLAFDAPFGGVETRVIMAFERDVLDREFVCTIGFKDVNSEGYLPIEQLSYSATLMSSYVYVPKLTAGIEFRTKPFRVPTTADWLCVEVLPWSDKSICVREALRGLALEVPTVGLGMPDGWGRIVLAGNEAPIEPR